MVNRRWVWLETIGVGKRYIYMYIYNYRFPHITYPNYSCICLLAAANILRGCFLGIVNTGV